MSDNDKTFVMLFGFSLIGGIGFGGWHHSVAAGMFAFICLVFYGLGNFENKR